MKRLSRPIGFALIAALCALCLSGCLELIRRSAPSGSTDNEPFEQNVTPSGNSLSEGNVQGSTETREPEPPAEVASPPRNLPERTRQQEQRIRQVNEYALWCIENSMWNEARSHLERAHAQDSLSASLHNNLAIVYEHLGQADKAAEFYRRAHELGSGKGYYEANLELLERRQQAAADTSGQIDIFDLKQRIPGPRRDPYQPR